MFNRPVYPSPEPVRYYTGQNWLIKVLNWPELVNKGTRVTRVTRVLNTAPGRGPRVTRVFNVNNSPKLARNSVI